MAEQFRVGDIVECVDAKTRPAPQGFKAQPVRVEDILVEGALYTIRDVQEAWSKLGRYMGLRIILREPETHFTVWDGSLGGFCPDRFRLTHRPRAEFLTELLSAPVDAPAPTEDA